ncbi:MAG: hypothetical protein ACRCYT_01205 [Cetobacterium sp.]
MKKRFVVEKEVSKYDSEKVIITVKYDNDTIFYKGFEKNQIDIDLIERQTLNNLLQVGRISAVMYSEMLEALKSLNIEPIEFYREITKVLKDYNNDRVNQVELNLKEIKEISNLINENELSYDYLYELISDYITDRA